MLCVDASAAQWLLPITTLSSGEVESVIDMVSNCPQSMEVLAQKRFQRALVLLLEAADYARRVASDPWEFAVEIDQLRELGLSDNDLRFLVRSQYLEHAREVTSVGQNGRQFLPTGNLTFAHRTCFVLTKHRLDLAAEEIRSASDCESIRSPTPHISQIIPLRRRLLVPNWDSHRRILSCDGQVIKRFRRPARNQSLILAAFQEEDWPTRIYDPLAPQPCQDMKRRLNDTIKCLNRGQESPLLHFCGDGTGEGVLWEVVG